MKRKDLWLFLAKLIPLTLVLGWLWFDGWQMRYPYVLWPVAEPVFDLFGVKKWWMALVAEHFTNLVPYVALVLATPEIGSRWRRGLAALLGGTVIIVAGHLLLSVAVYHLHEAYGLSKAFYRFIVPLYLINDALPLALWLVFFPEMPERLFGLKIFSRREAVAA